jgi:hypothetical protein
MKERGTNEEEAHRRAAILEKMARVPVLWEDYREILEASEPWDPIRWPENHDWFLIKDVPLGAFREVTIDAVQDVGPRGERSEHRERYKAILKMLKKGASPWPVIVADTGMIIDGYHRLAAMNTLKRPSVDVLYVPV